MVWLNFCVLRWVTHKTINQPLNELHSNDSKERYSAITERTSNHEALRIKNDSVLPLLFRSYASVLEDFHHNFPQCHCLWSRAWLCQCVLAFLVQQQSTSTIHSEEAWLLQTVLCDLWFNCHSCLTVRCCAVKPVFWFFSETFRKI